MGHLLYAKGGKSEGGGEVSGGERDSVGPKQLSASGLQRRCCPLTFYGCPELYRRQYYHEGGVPPRWRKGPGWGTGELSQQKRWNWMIYA